MNELCAGPELPEDVEAKEDRYTDVRRDKILNVPSTPQEDRPSVENDDQKHPKSTEVRCVRLERRLVWERITINTLPLYTSLEAKESDKNDEPCDQAGDRAEINEPCEHLPRVELDVHVTQEAEDT